MSVRLWLAVIFMSTVSPSAFADLDVIEGEWTNSSNLIAITRAQSFGWNLWQDNKGRASIVQSAESGGNIQVTFPGGVICNYYVSTTNHEQRMVWTPLGNRPSSESCLQGIFDRVDQKQGNFARRLDEFYGAPQKPIQSGLWDIEGKCTHGKTLNIDFVSIGGRAARNQSGVVIDVNLGYLPDGRLRIIGLAGTSGESLSFVGNKNADGTFNGTGKWGNEDCNYVLRFRNDFVMHGTVLAGFAHYKTQLASVTIACNGKEQFAQKNLDFRHGVVGFAFESGTEHYTALLGMYFDDAYNNGRLNGKIYGSSLTTEMNFQFRANSKSNNSTQYAGQGKYGADNCNIVVESVP